MVNSGFLKYIRMLCSSWNLFLTSLCLIGPLDKALRSLAQPKHPLLSPDQSALCTHHISTI